MKVRRGDGPLRRIRAGATMVETAVALPICLLFLFGIIEYGRFAMMRNLLANAAREGARFAVIHTIDKTTADVQGVVLSNLSNQTTQIQNLTIQVYSTDANGNPVVGSDWTATPFGSGIGVQVDGDYLPLLPRFLLMPDMLHLQAVSVMNSEGN